MIHDTTKNPLQFYLTLDVTTIGHKIQYKNTRTKPYDRIRVVQNRIVSTKKNLLPTHHIVGNEQETMEEKDPVSYRNVIQ
jgi:uncharacterized protein (UPF0248 family)